MKKKKNLEKENQKIQEELIEEIKKTKQNKTKTKTQDWCKRELVNAQLAAVRYKLLVNQKQKVTAHVTWYIVFKAGFQYVRYKACIFKQQTTSFYDL